jgi:trehalose 6-phosphate synthase
MNLVAKEFVAARDDNMGVLVLSSFTGASREMQEALIINPYDTEGLASAVDRALAMPSNEQIERMKLMRAQIKENNVYRWAASILIDAARSRKRERLMNFGPPEDVGQPRAMAAESVRRFARRAVAGR